MIRGRATALLLLAVPLSVFVALFLVPLVSLFVLELFFRFFAHATDPGSLRADL